MKIFVIKDVKVGVYQKPICAEHEQVIFRTLTQIVNGPIENNLLASNPEDFQVFTLGTFDDKSGKIEVTEPEFVENVIAFKIQPGVNKNV